MDIYLIVINILGLVAVRYDKAQARAGTWRVSERNLLIVALIGGAAGVFLGMHLFRHKNKHLKFTVGVPAILFAELYLLSMASDYGLLRWPFVSP